MGKQPSRFVNKPWGQEEIFAVTDHYAGKILTIKQGESLSLQYHEKKEETLRVLDGQILFESGSSRDCLTEEELGAGDTFHVPPRLIHRMTAITDCRLLEVSTVELDDVVRLEDRYGREGTTAP